MMEEEFYSTIKLTSGEELISKVCYLPEEDSLLLDNPMLVEKHIQKIMVSVSKPLTKSIEDRYFQG